MKQVLIPLLITTQAALKGSLKEKSLLHIDNTLFQRQPARIMDLMAKNSYSQIQQQTKSGVFFYRTADGFVFDPDIHEIHDPFAIL